MDEREFEKMKQDAQKIVNEYQSKAQPEPPSGRSDDSKSQKPHNETESKTIPTKSDGLLSSLLKDKDKTIILALIILLMDEGGNYDLLLALFYLIM